MVENRPFLLFVLTEQDWPRHQVIGVALLITEIPNDTKCIERIRKGETATYCSCQRFQLTSLIIILKLYQHQSLQCLAGLSLRVSVQLQEIDKICHVYRRQFYTNQNWNSFEFDNLVQNKLPPKMYRLLDQNYNLSMLSRGVLRLSAVSNSLISDDLDQIQEKKTNLGYIFQRMTGASKIRWNKKPEKKFFGDKQSTFKNSLKYIIR